MAEIQNQNVEITESDFCLVHENTKIYDEKLETKATTFLKDAFKRFCKNKSSVVGAIIIGLIIILAIFIPMVSPHNVDSSQIYTTFLPPKLFRTGNGFWDGTKKYTNIVFDENNKCPADFKANSVVKIYKITDDYINSYSKYAKGGTLIFANNFNKVNENTTAIFYHNSEVTFIQEDNLILKLKLSELNELKNYKNGEYRIVLMEKVGSGTTASYVEKTVLQNWSKNYGEITINVSDALKANSLNNVLGRIQIELKQNDYEVVNEQPMGQSFLGIQSLVMEATTNSLNQPFDKISINDANETVGITSNDENNKDKYWASTGSKELYQASIKKIDFLYDWYNDKLGADIRTVGKSDIEEYMDKGWCEFEIDMSTGEYEFVKLSDKCPIDRIESVKNYDDSLDTYELNAEILKYKTLGYDDMPKFLLGTDDAGYDLITLCFKGLRMSLIIAFASSAVCFIFGLCWGAISGYFGGNVDLIMERFCDILGGIPWIVMMTLAILLLGNNIITFALALCLTGWMGTAARTRTQFYRFKGREYILASRTLGAGDFRLIFKHILPNAMGTIITSSVLMIPSTIFSETTLSYLNLGLQGSNSFGNILSKNQQYISNYPMLIVFPAIIISLIMISFNLFGNGLRDAFNPSLKGSE